MFDAVLTENGAGPQTLSEYKITWADVDLNGHVRSTAYMNYVTNARVEYFGARGAPIDGLIASGLGPVMLREFVEYKREARLGDLIRIRMKLKGLSETGERWVIQHEVVLPDEKTAVIVDVEGAWLDIQQRKMVVPPPHVKDVFLSLERAKDYAEISARRPALEIRK
ncbi:MAG: acyl-CoA thioesterase [Leptospiraceae bacterium]|nr:acyl-CoA thioesterase [Leptospiraceae bacterium]